MKFSLRDLEYKLGGWTYYFKRVRTGSYDDFQEKFCNFEEEKYSESGNIDWDKLDRKEKKKVLESGFSFLLQNLAKVVDDESGEELEDKETALGYVWPEPEFIQWRNGYINGEKKT